MTTFRLGALLCLSGLAACSQTHTEPATAPTPEAQSMQTATDPALRPASLETAPTETARMAPAPSAADNDTRAPLVADSQASNAANPAEPPRAPAGAPETAEPAHPAADDTKVNERDTKSGALTPMDQNNNANDLKITQRIRQAVMADDSLSFTAKNVKIITQNGKVTLRGPVNSAQERSAIDAAARKVAGAAQVDNQLEVKK